ncbi:hypothetical protein Bcon01_66680 [Burkholderia contaminans]|jgi:hypothetical protein|nr:hypothetical protein Bcon01_66680 [Burkholderia contaminans]
MVAGQAFAVVTAIPVGYLTVGTAVAIELHNVRERHGLLLEGSEADAPPGRMPREGKTPEWREWMTAIQLPYWLGLGPATVEYALNIGDKLPDRK